MSHQDPTEEARQSLLDKSSKLEVARQAILTQDLAELAKADRDKVKRLEEKRLFGGDAMPKDDETIIVCDDYRYNDPPAPVPQASPVWPIALGILGAGGILASALYLMKPANPVPLPTPGTTTTIRKTEGFIIDLPEGVKP